MWINYFVLYKITSSTASQPIGDGGWTNLYAVGYTTSELYIDGGVGYGHFGHGVFDRSTCPTHIVRHFGAIHDSTHRILDTTDTSRWEIQMWTTPGHESLQ